MRLLHTSDWHLGQVMYEHGRTWEHARFLAWLLDTLAAERIDALLIAGDVFDTANPPADAQAAFFEFLAAARSRFPALDIVVIGGNHDSASRLDAPAPLLDAFRVHVVGGFATARHVTPVHDAAGRVAAWVCAVPFLRPADLPHPAAQEDEGDRLVEGVRRVYTETLAEARRRRAPGQALVAMGHCYMVGGATSELSERKILGGNQHALPADIFPDDVAYVALGHLHLAQEVGGRRGVRYCGSPIPLAMTEAEYPHQVCVVELDGELLVDVRAVKIPREVDLVRIGPAPLPDVLLRLRTLPHRDAIPRERWPYVDIAVDLPGAEPGLRRQVEEALDGRGARLTRIVPRYTGTGLALSMPGVDLKSMSVEDVFLRRYARDHREPPPAGLLEAFHEMVGEASALAGVR